MTFLYHKINIQWRWLAFEIMLSSGAYTQEWGTVIWLDAWELVISDSCQINKLWQAEISTPLLISYVHAPVKTNICFGNCLSIHDMALVYWFNKEEEVLWIM